MLDSIQGNYIKLFLWVREDSHALRVLSPSSFRTITHIMAHTDTST